MGRSHRVVFLFDVDNTLLDNDQIIADLQTELDRRFGPERRKRYFAIFEDLRETLGYADYLGSLQRYRLENPTEPHLLEISSFLVDYRFADRLYPRALETIGHCRKWGPAVVLSDGDVVFQPRKVERSGIARAVDGHVLIYVHKEQMLADVEAKYPAEHYVMVDDKVRILAAVKKQWGGRMTGVFPRQGHYALDQAAVRSYPPPDIAIERIGQMMDYDLATFLA